MYCYHLIWTYHHISTGKVYLNQLILHRMKCSQFSSFCESHENRVNFENYQESYNQPHVKVSGTNDFGVLALSYARTTDLRKSTSYARVLVLDASAYTFLKRQNGEITSPRHTSPIRLVPVTSLAYRLSFIKATVTRTSSLMNALVVRDFVCKRGI